MTEEKQIQQNEHEELNVLMIRRREELEQLKKLGINPYPYEFSRDGFSTEIIESYKEDAEQRIVVIAGRILSIRRMGKASFWTRAQPHSRLPVN